MKNDYEVNGDITIVYINRTEGEQIEVIIDTEDLEKVKSFPNSWGATKVRGSRWLIKGKNKVRKNIPLTRFILDVTDNSPVRFINGNQLDHRKSNLTVGYEEVQITKGNEYEVKGDIAFLKLNRRDGSSITTQIDAEDLQRVLEKGTWFTEWHSDFENYLVHNVTYCYVNGKKHRKKTTLHSFIMGVDNKEPIRHADKNTLNNCKANLKVYSRDMMNDYEEMENDTVAIILRDKHGKEKARTLIDKEDLERVKTNGYTWVHFKGKGYPYAVSYSPEGRIYLHRFIMNTPDGMVTDHLNHNTLDNRKSNLRNATISQNQQNRAGSRKGSKSGVRGVSWDETNQDWIVNVKGIYYGRFKDIEEAKKLAQEKIEEQMPFLK
ncbi:HNH endonuclease [Neobacillus sp. YIM B06451]|uniref:HNH endonuclease n=1 Tax=Neobacillus sp. YIM B06451 TaxID=3070994 RepID=UPI002931ED4F|nr:HNH endonuclease [Neobacillus sp. YIM B06451]